MSCVLKGSYLKYRADLVHVFEGVLCYIDYNLFLDSPILPSSDA